MDTPSDRPPRRGWLVLTGVMLVLGLWLLEPRFAISEPSLVDDWNARDKAARGFDALIHLEWLTGTPPGADSGPTRYRPSYAGIWSPLTWETFGGAGNLTAPNIWNGLRLALVIVSVSALSLAALASPARHCRGNLTRSILAIAPIALILSTPPMAVTFARFGPNEPLMVGGMAGGAVLLLVGLRNWLADGRAKAWRVVAPLAAGECLWVLGIYAKEPSICVALLLPFAYLHLDRRWRDAGLIDGPLIRRPPLAVVTGLMLVPVVHMTAMVARIAEGGRTTYNVSLPSAGDSAGWAERISSTIGAQWDVMTQLADTPFWRGLALALPFLLLAAMLHRRRVAWLALGFAVMGWAVMLFQGLGGGVAPRYYLPVFVLFAIAAVMAAAELPPWFRAAALAAAALFVIANAPRSHEEVEGWAVQELQDAAAVRAVADLNPGYCPVYHSGLDLERSQSLPTLAAQRRSGSPRCNPRFAALLVQPSGATAAIGYIGNACEAPGWRPLRPAGSIHILGCRRLAERPVSVAGIGVVSVAQLLQASRLHPVF